MFDQVRIGREASAQKKIVFSLPLQKDGVMKLSAFKLLSAFFRLVIDGCTLTFCMAQDGRFS